MFAWVSSASAQAQEPQGPPSEQPAQSQQKPAPKPDEQAAVLWYRSTEDCPDGAAFLARVGDRAPLIRLAQAGDRVDFVVNLAQTPEGARGQLERESGQGTVAIRQVTDPSCGRVADVLALNLALALDPTAETAGTPQDGPAPSTPVEKPEVTEATEAPPTTGESTDSELSNQSHSSKNTTITTKDDTPPPPTRHDSSSLEVRLGVQGGVLSGVARHPMGRASAFFEVSGLFSKVLPDLTIRGAGVGAWGASNTTSGRIRQTIWAGRLALCPVAWENNQFSLAPCAMGEIGQLQATGPYKDTGLWGALGVHLHGRWVVARPFAVEAEVGGLVPLQRYSINAGSTTLYRSSLIGMSASLGTSFAF